MSEPEDHVSDYLWDRSGEPDREVVELERVLGQFRHDGRPFTGLRATRSRRRGPWLLVAAAAALIAAGIWWTTRGPVTTPGGLYLAVGDDGVVVDRDEWFTATATANALRLGDMADLTFVPGSRVQLKLLGDDVTRLFLERGQMDAFVSLEAKPGFFQVDTPSARCTDLGCFYTLTVDEQTGDAHVVVDSGRVEFEHSGRQAFVPAAAECRASRAKLGTPRFVEWDESRSALLDRYDALGGLAAEPRWRVVEEFCAKAEDILKDTLPLWHFLQDPDPRIRASAEAKLIALAGMPEEVTAVKGVTITLQQWRDHLELLWW